MALQLAHETDPEDATDTVRQRGTAASFSHIRRPILFECGNLIKQKKRHAARARTSPRDGPKNCLDPNQAGTGQGYFLFRAIATPDRICLPSLIRR